MNLDHQALGEPYLWTVVSRCPQTITVQHPNGRVLDFRIVMENFWRVLGQDPQTSSGTYHLASFHRRSPQPEVQDAVEDTLRVAGPDARAQLDQLLQEIRAWTITYPGHQDVVLFNRSEGTLRLSPTIGPIPLPKALRPRWAACKHVLHPQVKGPRMDTLSPLRLDLPTTAHGRLALRHHIQEAA